ncbi:MAG: carboxyl transferase [Lachnospiraceae bacterium]|nr:carboxyl transferase [Lachnospiraceae bacterium]
MKEFSNAKKRIYAILDDNSFVEMGALVKARATGFNLTPEEAPSDGVVCGYGLVDGRLVYVYSQDAEVLGGTVGEMHAKKIIDLYRMAIRTGAPVIGLLDSQGIRLQEGTDALDAFSGIYSQMAKASGLVPQITAVFGSCGGGLSVIPSLSDFSYIAEDARLFVNLPLTRKGSMDGDHFADAATQAKNGVVDAALPEVEILARIRDLVSFLPQNNEAEAFRNCEDDLNRECLQAAEQAADLRAVLTDIADDNCFFEVKEGYAGSMLTGFIRLNGASVGVFGNAEGELSADGMEKAASFVTFCDAFSIPVISFTNANGFKADEAEEKTAAKAAAKLIAALAGADTVKVNVILGEAIGSAYSIMNPKALGSDLVIALQEAHVGIMDADAASKILADGKDVDEIEKTKEAFEKMQNGIESIASRGSIDQIAEAKDLRKFLVGALEVLYSKRILRYPKKHGSGR